VKCVKRPEDNNKFLKFWDNFMKHQAFDFRPQPNGLYIVRANVGGPPVFTDPDFGHGIVLYENGNKPFKPLRNKEVSIGYTGAGIEPFFPYSMFTFVKDRS
jgi:hypothetical protein